MTPALDGRIAELLARCAAFVVRRRKPFVVGITGSVGKSSAKEAIGAVLAHEAARPRVGWVERTKGNQNDFLWFSLRLLRYPDRPHTVAGWLLRCVAAPFRALALATFSPYPRTLVLECAANTRDGIERRMRVVRPDIAVVTAVGPAHLEGFGSVEGVAQSKGALVRAVAPDGLVVLGADNRHASAMDAMTSAEVIKVPGRGRELAANIARVVGRRLGVPDDAIEQALGSLPPMKGRLRLVELDGITMVDDAHNASPLAMELALDTMAAVAGAGRRAVAVLGGMVELALESDRYHEEIAAYARARGAILVGVGDLARGYRPDHWFESSEACAAGLGDLLSPGDVVLVKGSQKFEMWRVVDRLASLAPANPSP